MGTSPTETLSSRLFCTECGRPFAPDDVVRFGARVVCAECKPRFVQAMREGVPGAARAIAYGGFWRRFAAVLIDYVIMLILTSPLSIAMAMFFTPEAMRSRSFLVGWVGFNWTMSTLICCAYYSYFLSQKGATPGKMVLGLKVITATGERVSVARAIGRYFANAVSGIILCIGYIMVVFDTQKRALHDYICDTRVIVER